MKRVTGTALSAALIFCLALVGVANFAYAHDTGACCFPYGGCSLLTQGDCEDEGGTYKGDGEGCDPNPCEVWKGACCLSNGGCLELSTWSCSGIGKSWTRGGTCDPDLCETTEPTGSCCLDDGSCLVLPEADCAAAGGLYTAGANCGVLGCPVLTGACCLPDGSCADNKSESECMDIGGKFQGKLITCDDVSCSPSVIPTFSQWGLIILSVLMAGCTFWRMRRRKKTM